MDTPDKGKITASSLSNFEDSPVFRFIDSLSPINPVKSVHAAHILNSPALASPSLLFPSPQISSIKDSRFCARRNDLSEDSNVDVLESEEGKNTSDGDPEIVDQSNPSDKKLGRPNGDFSAREVTTKWHGEQLDLKTELPKILRYYHKSSDDNLVPWNKVPKDEMFSVAGPQEGRVRHYEGESLKEKRSSFEGEINLHSINNITQKEESTESDMLQMVCDVADQLYNSASGIYDDTEGHNENNVELGASNMSTVLDLQQFNTGDLETLEAGGHSASLEEAETGEPETKQTPAVVSTSLPDKLDLSSKVEKGGKWENSSCEHSALRRCLLFETAGGCKRKTVQGSTCNYSTSSGIDDKTTNTEEHLVPTIGLHLNSLTNASRGGSTDRNLDANGNELMDAENSPESTHISDEVDQNRARKKRSKLEQIEETVACKRCNCKRSKCLKLYCDCFAAGLYCIEPCSCQDCFNKPIHEGVVLETRKLIESRNPLAFAPKVIRSEATVPEFGREINKTPASARHKRGCNCKKSSCLKKYCECFQEGVGCSTNCRCEGCKNTFGQKGVETDGAEVEDLKLQEKNASNLSSRDNLIQKEEEHSDFSAPSKIFRPPIRLRGSFLRLVGQSLLPTTPKHTTKVFLSRHLDSEAPHLMNPEDETSEVSKTDCLPHGCVKSHSPTGKRVSPSHHEPSSSIASLKGRKLILRSVPPFPSLCPPSKE